MDALFVKKTPAAPGAAVSTAPPLPNAITRAATGHGVYEHHPEVLLTLKDQRPSPSSIPIPITTSM